MPAETFADRKSFIVSPRSADSSSQSQDDFSRKDFDLGADGPVHCLEYDTDTRCFALSIGHHVYLAHESCECQSLASHSTS